MNGSGGRPWLFEKQSFDQLYCFCRQPCAVHDPRALVEQGQPSHGRGIEQASVPRFVSPHLLLVPPLEAERLVPCGNGVRESEPSLAHAGLR